jgi:hypothetical protein
MYINMGINNWFLCSLHAMATPTPPASCVQMWSCDNFVQALRSPSHGNWSTQVRKRPLHHVIHNLVMLLDLDFYQIVIKVYLSMTYNNSNKALPFLSLSRIYTAPLYGGHESCKQQDVFWPGTGYHLSRPSVRTQLERTHLPSTHQIHIHTSFEQNPWYPSVHTKIAVVCRGSSSQISGNYHMFLSIPWLFVWTNHHKSSITGPWLP